jgi:hypothetical protein
MELISESKLHILKSKAEALSLTCNLANVYWNRVKMFFNIPLVLTSSVMAIINSLTTDGNDVKLANIIVNSVSVLIISLNNSIKASEKADNFKKLSQGFLSLVTEIENDDVKDLHLYNIKFNNLINDIEFSDISPYIKKQVNMYFEQDELPLQIKIIDYKKRIEMSKLKMINSHHLQSLSGRPSVELENINFSRV